MNLKTDKELFAIAIAEEKLAKVKLSVGVLTEEQLQLLCENTDILFAKTEKLPQKLRLCGTNNIKRVIFRLIGSLETCRQVAQDLTTCENCGYYPFIVPSMGNGKCPKCGKLHLRP